MYERLVMECQDTLQVAKEELNAEQVNLVVML